MATQGVSQGATNIFSKLISGFNEKGNICRLFGRTTEWNIAIYITGLIFVLTFGIMWIYAKTRDDVAERNLWESRSYIGMVVGIIVVAFLLTGNMIFYEVSFNKKCDAFERYINGHLAELKSNLDVDNVIQRVTSRTANGIADKVTTKFMDALKTAAVNKVTAETGLPLGELASLFGKK